MNNPLVSICIPTYNGEAFVSEAMESALNQTYKNIEIIVSDDASTDDTLRIINTYKPNTIPIHIFNHKPSGIGANWNHSIEKAKGEYIKFLFQDDVLEPTCVDKMITALHNNKEHIGIVACRRTFIIDKEFRNEKTNTWLSKYSELQKGLNMVKHPSGVVVDKTIFRSSNFFKIPKNKIGEPTTYLFKRELVEKIGYFREDLKQILDYEFCYRVLKKYKILVLNEPLIKFRLHEMQATNINKLKKNNENKIHEDIIYKEYFWSLNRNKQLELLRKRNKVFSFLFNLAVKIFFKK